MFKKYKNIHLNESAYILGSGPTMESFPVNDYHGIYIGINDIHLRPQIKDKLNYLITEKYFENLDLLPDDLTIFHCDTMELTKPNSFKYRLHLVELSDVFEGTSAKIIKRFNGCSSVVFHGLFFALYIGCKKIYLVGCDSSNNTNRVFPLPKLTETPGYTGYIVCWHFVKKYVEENHPDVEIININPIKLKDIFHSIYT